GRPACRADPDLPRLEPRLPRREHRLGPLARALQLTERRVRGEARRRPTEQDGHRLAGQLAEDVPQGGLQRPVTARVEPDALDRAYVAGGLARGAAHEKLPLGTRPRPAG